MQILINFHYFTDSFHSEAADGLKYYDLVEGKGPIAEKGATVQVRLQWDKLFLTCAIYMDLPKKPLFSFSIIKSF